MPYRGKSGCQLVWGLSRGYENDRLQFHHKCIYYFTLIQNILHYSQCHCSFSTINLRLVLIFSRALHQWRKSTYWSTSFEPSTYPSATSKRPTLDCTNNHCWEDQIVASHKVHRFIICVFNNLCCESVKGEGQVWE